MKRRLMIARALLHCPALLFLDEPTVGLDAQTRRRIWELIRTMNLTGTTILLTTHYIEEAESLCGRVGIIDHGRLITLGTPVELRRQLGMVAVETIAANDETGYSYFADNDSARSYVQRLPEETKTIIVRDSNLEDVFIELTGRKVNGG
jgi:ABC-2 type transport system ATP-binding protein